MKNLKKGISLLLASTLVLASVAGCGNKSSGNNQDAGKENVNFNKTGLPIVNDKVTYKLMVKGRTGSQKTMEEKEIFKTFEKETNVHINWDEVPETGFNDKINITLNSGALPDGVFAGTPNMSDAVSAKLVIPFDDYMEYAPNLKKMFETVPESKIPVTSIADNKVYRYPGVHPKEYALVPYPTFINKAWLDKLGLKIPTTTDEFKNVLQAFKDNDCNGNGDKNDEVPLVSCEYWGGYWFQRLFGAWGIDDGVNTDKYATCTIRDGKLDFNPVNPKYREALEYFHDLYNKGLLKKDCMTIDEKTKRAQCKTDTAVAGVFIDWMSNFDAAQNNVDQYVVLPPLKGPEGEQKYSRAGISIGITDGLVIFKGCKSPEVLVRWMDYLNDGINPYRLYAGMEGENWKIDNDTKEFIPLKLASNIKIQGTDGIQNPPGCRDPRYTGIKTKAVAGTQEDLKPKWGEAYKPYLFDETWISISPIKPSNSESKEIGLLLTDLSAECQAFLVEAISKGISDSKWNEHIKKCERLEYKKVVEFWQEQYNDTRKLMNK